MSDLDIPNAVREAGWDAFTQATKDTVDAPQIYARTIHAVAPLIAAAELEQQADRVEDSAKAWGDPAPGTAAYSMAGVLADVVVELRLRAAELRGDRKAAHR